MSIYLHLTANFIQIWVSAASACLRHAWRTQSLTLAMKAALYLRFLHYPPTAIPDPRLL